jgi:DNA-binding transcriptional MerR regulator
MNQNQQTFRIGEVAKIIDRHPNTLRNWDSKGLITPYRDFNNHRVYSLFELLRIKEILAIRRKV